MQRMNASRGLGGFLIALGTAAVTEHFAFAPWEVALVALAFGLGAFFLTATD
jgi:hypothetical protein